MKPQFLVFATVISVSASAAHADYVDTKVQELFAQGFTHFEVARGTVKSQVEAYAPDGKKMVIIMDNQSESIFLEQTLAGTTIDFSLAASGITAVYAEQSNNNHVGGISDDNHSGGSDDSVGGISDDNHSGGGDDSVGGISDDDHSGGSDNDDHDDAD